MPSKADQKKAEERAEATLEEGYYVAQEGEDNSLATSDDAYVGVSPEYRNAANDTDKPLVSEDDDLRTLEEAAKDREREAEEAAKKVGFRGYEPTTPHPREATQPAAARIEQNRAVEAAAANDARAKLEASSSSEPTGSPFGDEPQS